MPGTKADASQNQLFITQEDKQQLLRSAEFRLTGVIPRGFDKVKKLLWAIETTPPDARTAEVLSAKMGTARSTYWAALELSKLLEVLEVAEHRGRLNTFRVDWQNIRSYAAQVGASTGPASRGGPTQVGGVRLKSGGSDLVKNPQKMNKSGGSDFHVHDDVNSKNHSSSHDGRSPGGWPFTVTIDVLRDPKRIGELFRYAVSREWVTAGDQIDFFACARAVRRGAESGIIRVSGAKFTSIVKSKLWGFASPNDRERAQAAVGEMTHVQPQ